MLNKSNHKSSHTDQYAFDKKNIPVIFIYTMIRYLIVLLTLPLLLCAKPKVVFIAGYDSHGAGAHEHTAGCNLLAAKLNATNLADCSVVYESDWPKTNAVFEAADTIIVYADGFHKHPLNTDGRWQALEAILEQGTGFGALHYGCAAHKDPYGAHMLAWTGGNYERGWSTNPFWNLTAILDQNHPISRGVEPFEIRDEWYFNIRFTDQPGLAHVLRGKPGKKARSRGGPQIRQNAGREETTLWAFERPGGGRGFGFTGGHWHANWRDDAFRKIVLNAILWSAGAEVPALGVSTPTPTKKEMALPKNPVPFPFVRRFARVAVSQDWPKSFRQLTKGDSFTTVSNTPLRTRGQTVTLASDAQLQGIAVQIAEASGADALLHLTLRHADQILARYTFDLPQNLQANDVLKLSFPALKVPAGRFSFHFEPISDAPFELRLRASVEPTGEDVRFVDEENPGMPAKSLAYALIGSSD